MYKRQNQRGIISKQRSTGGSGSLLAYIKDTSELHGGIFNYAHDAKFSINSKNWAHGCFTSDAVTAKLFYNGNLVAFDMISSTSETSSTSRILIGKELSVPANDGERLFMGSIDDVRIYDRALSEDEIRLLYEAELELPAQSVTSAKLSPALSDLIDGNGSLEQVLPAGCLLYTSPSPRD